MIFHKPILAIQKIVPVVGVVCTGDIFVLKNVKF